jgi:APA family basic amino acid/polyamine antiporter
MSDGRAASQDLRRDLTLADASSLVVGTVIGTGIFLKAAVMTQEAGSPILVLLAWVAAGAFSLAGALTYAELGAMMPRAGGEYVYLREGYGELPAFLFGWASFVLGGGSVAAYGAAFATFLSAIVPLGNAWFETSLQDFGHTFVWQLGPRQIIALLPIAAITARNCVRVGVAGRAQTVLTAIKLLGIAVLIGGLFFLTPGGDWSHVAAPAVNGARGGLSGFGAAMLAALWAYSGWHFLPRAAGEVRHPSRNVPLALGAGVATVIAAYCLVNVAYFYGLGAEQVAAANSTIHPDAPSVGVRAAASFLGPGAVGLLAIAFMLSTIGSLNGELLAAPRVFFAMARDRLFFSRVGLVRDTAHVPAWSVFLYAVWGAVFVLSGTFDQLTNMAVIGNLFFWTSAATVVIVLRRRRPHAQRPYRVPLYPLLPAAFALFSVWLIYNTLQTNPGESWATLALIGSGLPVYLMFKRDKRAPVPPVSTTI